MTSERVQAIAVLAIATMGVVSATGMVGCALIAREIPSPVAMTATGALGWLAGVLLPKKSGNGPQESRF